MKLSKNPIGLRPGRAEESYLERERSKVLTASPSPKA